MGWRLAAIVGSFVVAGVLLAAFVALERHQRLPMLDLTLFRDATFTGANTVMLLSSLAMFGVFFYVTLYMQQVLGLSPVKAGALFLPMTVLIINDRAARRAHRGPDRLAAAGGGRADARRGLALSVLAADRGVEPRLPDAADGDLGGAGMAMTMTPATAAALAAVPRQGRRRLGRAEQRAPGRGSIGIALMGAVVANQSGGADDSGEAFMTAVGRGSRGGGHRLRRRTWPQRSSARTSSARSRRPRKPLRQPRKRQERRNG